MKRTPILQLLVVYCISLFWSCYTVLFSILPKIVLKGQKQFFKKVNRDKRPEVCDDPSLGTHGFASLKSVKLHYVACGSEDKPLMLFLHGFPEFWYSWRHQMKEFAKDYRCVAVDMRGYNESDKPSGVHNYSMDKLTGDIKELIAALGYEKCTLVAHDWGGAVAWDLTWRHPEVVERFIVCNCPNGRAFQKHMQNDRSQFFKSWYMFLFQMPYLPELVCRMEDWDLIDQAFIGEWLGCQKTGAFSVADLHAYKYAAQNSGMTAPINYYRATFRYQADKYTTKKVEVPTLIVWGTDDKALGKPLAELSRQYCEDGTVQYIEGCSHWVQQEEPEQVNSIMREWLASKQ